MIRVKTVLLHKSRAALIEHFVNKALEEIEGEYCGLDFCEHGDNYLFIIKYNIQKKKCEKRQKKK